MNEMSPRPAPTAPLKAKDYASDQEVRWCPGCGDYAILKAVQRTLADLGSDPDQTVFVSGIGCAARLPYYMETYGFHTIHGRAPGFATGIKAVNPALDVWLVSGDGDAMSIGGNHLLHLLRRDIDLQFLLFNNEVYGLTKGQASPTSQPGLRTPSTPTGATGHPAAPCVFAIGAGATFVARSADTFQTQLPEVLKAAHAHKGTGFVEILQNCIIYNDGAFSVITDKGAAAETTLALEHGRPMVFGKDRDKGLRLRPGTLRPEVATLGDGVTEADLLVHDETDPTLGYLLAGLRPPQFPVVTGVIHRRPGGAVAADETAVRPAPAQVAEGARARIRELLYTKGAWTVK